jgi:TonB family protein
MRILIFIMIGTASCLAADPSVAPTPRRYTSAEWQLISAKFIERPTPMYPRRLRILRLRGSGNFRLHIDTQGQVTAVDTLKTTGDKELDHEAIKALLRWRAKPGPRWEVDVPVTFFLPPQW